jgi:CRP-like cAMP-binding protein
MNQLFSRIDKGKSAQYGKASPKGKNIARTKISTYRNILQNSPLFAQLDDVLLDDMMERFQVQSWPAKRAVPLETISENFHVIVSGRARIEQIESKSGRTVTIFLLAPGDVFDILQLLTNIPCEGIITAIDRLELLTISTREVRRWIGSHPEFNISFLPYLGRQIRTLVQFGGDLALHDTETRLAHLVMRHIDYDDDGQFHIRLINDLPHEVLASMIGSVRAVVNRQLQNWRRRGLISLEHGHIHIEKLDRLLQRAENYRLPCAGNPDKKQEPHHKRGKDK